MNRPYSLDLDGLDGISAIEPPGSDLAAVENVDIPVESCDSATSSGEGIVSVAESNTLLRGIAALVAVGLIGWVGFMALRMGESDIISPSAAIISETGTSDELNGRDPDSNDRPYPVSASGHPRSNGPVDDPEAGERHDETGLKSSVKVGSGSDRSATLGPIQDQHGLDTQQTILSGEFQAQVETSSEAMFESGLIQSGEALSAGVPPTSRIVAQIVTSTGIASGFTSNGVLGVGEFVISFGFNEMVAKDLSASALHNLKAIAERCPHTIRVIGHTCGIGPFSSNMAVARERALSVRDILVDQGLSVDRIEVVSAGNKEPIASNNTWSGRRLNRRVVVGCLTNAEKFGEEKL